MKQEDGLKAITNTQILKQEDMNIKDEPRIRGMDKREAVVQAVTVE